MTSARKAGIYAGALSSFFPPVSYIPFLFSEVYVNFAVELLHYLPDTLPKKTLHLGC